MKDGNIMSPQIRKTFWRPVLSEKNSFLTDEHKKKTQIIFDNFDFSKEFSTFLEDAVMSLNVKPDEHYLSDTENLIDCYQEV